MSTTKRFNNLKDIIPFLIHQNIKEEDVLILSPSGLLPTLNIVKHHVGLQLTLLTCISGVDFLTKKYRFCIVYDLLSITFNSRLRLKVIINEVTSVSTASSIFINSNWWEREIWDLYGVYFDNHPDLRRILTDYGFEGHPLRKDFPLSGFVETNYDESKKRVVVKPVEFSQEFRLFTQETPW
jgi:NADH dehydrogenase (ubiquinone) Fe-S protein 3